MSLLVGIGLALGILGVAALTPGGDLHHLVSPRRRKK
jgi:hypothetical protein